MLEELRNIAQVSYPIEIIRDAAGKLGINTEQIVEMLQFQNHPMLTVRLPSTGELQAFYQRSGFGGSNAISLIQPGSWAPFDGLTRYPPGNLWFDKAAYTNSSVPPHLLRAGTQELADISNVLDDFMGTGKNLNYSANWTTNSPNIVNRWLNTEKSLHGGTWGVSNEEALRILRAQIERGDAYGGFNFDDELHYMGDPVNMHGGPSTPSWRQISDFVQQHGGWQQAVINPTFKAMMLVAAGLRGGDFISHHLFGTEQGQAQRMIDLSRVSEDLSRATGMHNAVYNYANVNPLSAPVARILEALGAEDAATWLDENLGITPRQMGHEFNKALWHDGTFLGYGLERIGEAIDQAYYGATGDTRTVANVLGVDKVIGRVGSAYQGGVNALDSALTGAIYDYYSPAEPRGTYWPAGTMPPSEAVPSEGPLNAVTAESLTDAANVNPYVQHTTGAGQAYRGQTTSNPYTGETTYE